MSVLYDIALVIGNEISVSPLLTRTVQRILYHTSFPTGLVFLDLPPDGGEETIHVPLAAAVGDFGFSRLVGQVLEVPAALLRGAAEMEKAPELLQSLPGGTRSYGVCLRLPIGSEGVMLLLAPRQPSTELPLTQIFQPVMANLAKSILLCRHNDAFTSTLMAERDMAKQSQVESEEKFYSITTVAPDAIVMIDDQGFLAYWNPAAERMFGYSAENVIGRKAHQLIAPARYLKAFEKGFASFVATGTGPVIGKTLEIEALRRDGSEFPVELSISSLNLNEHWHAVGILRDITARKQVEFALEHANRALVALGTVNRELVRATNEAALLQAICQAVVVQKGYSMAWVGYVQHDETKSIRLMASAGDEHGILAKVQPGWGEDELGSGPSGQAVRSGRTQVVPDIGKDPEYQSWGEALLRQGCVSSIALPLASAGEVFGILHVYAREVDAFTAREVDLLEEMAADLAFGVNSLRIRLERDSAMAQNQQHLARMHESLAGTVDAIARAVEARDPYTAGHQRRVASLARAIAASMGLDDDRIEGIGMGAMIHDIGKIQIPSEILAKPAKLTELEYRIIKDHPKIGYEILKDIHFSWPVANIAYQHHERMDGSGYPQGLNGEEICLEARIVAVADVVEAMASYRPYRAGLGIDKALAEIRQNRGTLYDTVAADACLGLFEKGNFSLDVD